MRSDHYQTLIAGYRALGLEVGASQRSVKFAYRKLIKEWHPDVNNNTPRSEEKTKEINNAFSRLKSVSADELRGLKAFHRSAKRPATRARARPKRRPAPRRKPPGRRHQPQAAGTGAAARHRRPGRNVVGKVNLSPQEELLGARWQLSIPTCHACGGWGAAIDAELTICEDCHGLGACSLPWPTSTCTRCNGRGGRYDLACNVCRGYGNSSSYGARFHVPPGIGRNFYGLVDGLGHPGIGGAAPGDLYLLIL